MHVLFNFQQLNWGGRVDWKATTQYVIRFVRCMHTGIYTQTKTSHCQLGTIDLRSGVPLWYRHLVAKSSTISGQLDIWSALCSDWPSYGQLIWAQMYPPGRGIWWPIAILHQVILTFSQCLGQADILIVNSVQLIWAKMYPQ